MTEKEMVRLVTHGFAGIVTDSRGPAVRLPYSKSDVVIRRDLPKLPVTTKEGATDGE